MMSTQCSSFRRMLQLLAACAILLVAVAGAPAANVLLVTLDGDTNQGGDDAIKTRLEALGHTVTLTDHNTPASAANGMDLVVISSSVGSGNVEPTFVNTAVPVLALEVGVWDGLNMTGATNSANIIERDDLNVRNNFHPMGAGLTGNQTFYNDPVKSGGTMDDTSLGFAAPASNAAVAAYDSRVSGTGAGDPILFSYDQGDLLFDGSTQAPAKRVALGLIDFDQGPAKLTTAGGQLFDAAVDFALAKTLFVDIGTTGQNVLGGYRAFTDAAANGDPTETNTYTSSIGTVDVTLSAPNVGGPITNLGFRNRGTLTGAFADASDLLGDEAKANGLTDTADNSLFLTLSGLDAGVYEITTFHHDQAVANGIIDILLSDALGSDQLVVDDLIQTGGSAPTSIATATFNFTANGIDDIIIELLEVQAINDHAEAVLNGFQLTFVHAIPEPASASLLGFAGVLAALRRSRK
ncbi:PEP-CTERM sorting domain-containing protein [Planctomycetales bacterium ZRK34]|nr:PEP-CTERM sorting domain-containing protein [Planctomycetales bacterium ZRK34]